jgi:hypothetical protein
MLAFATVLLLPPAGIAEVVYLHNGDVFHGSVIGASERAITLKTTYGNLVIPKTDIKQIDYQGAEPAAEKAPEKKASSTAKPPAPKPVKRAPRPAGRSVIALDIRGGSFWYAFTGSDAEPADVRIRLRVFVGGEEAVLLLDDKYDTVDGNTKFNSFTFAPGDTKVVSTSEGYTCGLEETGEGSDKGAVLVLGLPESTTDQRVLVRLLYQVNEGSGEFPRWTNAVSRSFPVPLEPGRESFLVLLQDASGVEFSGIFRKKMKNLESFQLRVLSSEVRSAS